MLLKYKPVFFLFLILLLTTSIYWVGLKGNFLFDDFPNLQDLGTYGVIDSWDKVRNFISNGWAGPTGRPIALLSFLLDANTWPAHPYPFKYTNLMIHLLNGVLLCWATLLLLRSYNYKEQQAVWIALVSTAIWLLHPYFVSTTLYVVQRMAQLATLFGLVGIIGYLKGRLLLSRKIASAYIWMTLSIGVGTILATYSKENGALLPLLILAIEFCNPDRVNKPVWQWKAICLWLPSIAIFVLLAKNITFDEHPWQNRNFNMVERLYSEARIVTEYLYNLFVPQIELRGLYQDGYLISNSLTQPITTLFSIILLLFLLISAFVFRKEYPLCAIAILFFFAAHLMESTVIGLELYFEHRNYMAALFLFLPIASGLYLLKEKIEPKLVYLILTIILFILSFFTYERAKLWGNTESLELYWAKNTPESPRAQNAIATVMVNQGRFDEANFFLEQQIKKIPDSALLNLRLLLQKVYQNRATREDFIIAANRAKIQPLDAQALQALRFLVEHIVNENKVKQYGDLSLYLLDEIDKNPKYRDFPVFQRLHSYLKAKVYLAENKSELALDQYVVALSRYNDVEAGMMMVAELGSTRHYSEALILLNHVEQVYQNQDVKTLKRSQKEYSSEIKRLRKILQNDIEKTHQGELK